MLKSKDPFAISLSASEKKMVPDRASYPEILFRQNKGWRKRSTRIGIQKITMFSIGNAFLAADKTNNFIK
ncbi:MAG: hypothetical protein AAGH46_04735 [Bacteroidota bacterium]